MSVDSKLLDMRDCLDNKFMEIRQEMLRIQLLQQPAWFRPLLLKSRRLKSWVSYNNWSRAWEYPWAITVSSLCDSSLRTLDVGGGNSPFSEYLSNFGHESYVIDSSLDQGVSSIISKGKGIYKNFQSLFFFFLAKFACVNVMWGLPSWKHKSSVHYYSYSATDIKFPDNYFDRVFCLSVMEHIPEYLWKRCIGEFERVLKSGGRLVITLDMGPEQAYAKQYNRLVDFCSLELIGNPDYEVPITAENMELRHPGHIYETIGLVWQG